MNQAFLDYYSLEPFTQWIHRTLCGVMPEDWAVFIEGLALGIVILLAYAVLAVVLIYMERRVCGAFQCRIGPNRVGGKGGLLQVPADVLKILTKEIIRLRKSDHVLYELAPYLVILASVISFSCLPWHKGAEVLDMQIGIFFVLAASSIGVIGILLAGWSSNNGRRVRPWRQDLCGYARKDEWNGYGPACEAPCVNAAGCASAEAFVFEPLHYGIDALERKAIFFTPLLTC